jgi:hypothetical protein
VVDRERRARVREAAVGRRGDVELREVAGLVGDVVSDQESAKDAPEVGEPDRHARHELLLPIRKSDAASPSKNLYVGSALVVYR